MHAIYTVGLCSNLLLSTRSFNRLFALFKQSYGLDCRIKASISDRPAGGGKRAPSESPTRFCSYNSWLAEITTARGKSSRRVESVTQPMPCMSWIHHKAGWERAPRPFARHTGTSQSEKPLYAIDGIVKRNWTEDIPRGPKWPVDQPDKSRHREREPWKYRCHVGYHHPRRWGSCLLQQGRSREEHQEKQEHCLADGHRGLRW